MKARTVALACGSGAAMFLVVLLLLATLAGAASLADGVPTSQATQDIPPSYLSLYQAAAETCSGLRARRHLRNQQCRRGRADADGRWRRPGR